jgi:PilZ domain
LNSPLPCVVLIGPPELLSTLKQSINTDSELLAFSDAEALRALEVISRRHPATVVVEQVFAKTPRGAALINRIKADPTLTQSVIRIVGRDAVEPRGAPPASPEPQAEAARAPTVPAAPLDQRGTRRAPRYKMAGSVELVADGNIVTVVDLSIIGAQIVSNVVLKPNQRLRVIMTDDQATMRFAALVAWAAFEIPPKSTPRYRAGVEFLDADTEAVGAFCLRHKAREG